MDALIDKELESFLQEALLKQASKRRYRNQDKKVSSDYATRLSEKALYRRLINESNIAQDGMRFIAFFGSPAHSEGQSLDWWRNKIDREIVQNSHRRSADKTNNLDSSQPAEAPEGHQKLAVSV